MLAGAVQRVGLGGLLLGVGGRGIEAVGGHVVDLLDELRALERERRAAEGQHGDGDGGGQGETIHRVNLPVVGWGWGGGSIPRSSLVKPRGCPATRAPRTRPPAR